MISSSLLLLLAVISCSLCQLDVCGQAPLNTKIVGGGDATAGAWPWQVSIRIACDGNLCYCGGSLITKDWVLSAAHCFEGASASDVVMYIGRQRQSGLNSNEINRTARGIIIHQYYNDTQFNNAIALVQLSSSVMFTDYIKPVCLAAAGSKFAGGTESWGTGWGTLQSGGQLADILQEVMIPVVSNSNCNKAYGAGITSNMICAGTAAKSSCQGDSGGPVVSRNASLWIQSGIVSFGFEKCDDPKYPSVFARVSQYQDWITSNIGSNPPGFVKFNNSGFRSSLNLLLFAISLMFSIIPFILSSCLSS
ncbi:chymotrypsin-like protease CTRL-1 [Labeo rohita]|uniref:Chymotrypsin-like protease CTRL-1 n=1 Tax=Labeo rohita TaxID=84645 RepID=A0A498M4X2_LABRO|nr:chymotrypsin-like protease CTRL-1 [Labeo rohita]